jgi:hypothetical protein
MLVTFQAIAALVSSGQLSPAQADATALFTRDQRG